MTDRIKSIRNAAEHYLPRALPQGLEALSELALDMRWSWNHEADQLWEKVSPELWEATGNPWLILQSVSLARLEGLARDSTFMAELRRLQESRADFARRQLWFTTTHGAEQLKPVAYFSMEFGLSEALPIYAGGLGILAGDHLKTASDLGVPLVGLGLLYQQGYFRQTIGPDGSQLAIYPYNNPVMLPVVPVRDAKGEWLRVAVELAGRQVYLRGWEVRVGNITLYLLDSNDPLNLPVDRGITGELYSGAAEMRLQQEIVLGIGGWRLLRELGISCEVCHLNEGHAAFVTLERARDFMQQTGCSFLVALRCTRVGNVFTTHTPVAAGFDRFSKDLMTAYFADYARTAAIGLEQLLALGRVNPEDSSEPFNMAYLALRGCGSANAVSRLHGRVSRRIFQPLFIRWPEAEVPVEYVTNGIHVPSWDSAAADALWTESCGKGRWMGELEKVEDAIGSLGDDALWTLRMNSRRAFVDAVRRRAERHRVALGDSTGLRTADHLDYNALTLGFARRFTGYKRPNLLLLEPERLTRILNNVNPVQLVVAGKAHPADEEGRRMVREWVEYARRPEVRGRVIFLEDYDMTLAAELVQGVDLWINTPRRPWEACGTSGMKLLVNGGLNLSELDGWWAEAYAPEVGWALGDRQEHEDPQWDIREAQELYRLLEQDIVPAFYERDARGIPVRWIARVRASMSGLAPRFSANRMVREYTQRCYLPAAQRYRRRTADNGGLGSRIEQWHNSLSNHWSEIRFGNLFVQDGGAQRLVRVQVYLGGMNPEGVAVELYADELDGASLVRVPMVRAEAITGAVNGWTYQASVGKDRSADQYTPRVVPYHPEASVPLEARQIVWFR
ncbi:MAG TPA: alpha-glucan family phosphorylase [Candidatus Binataceae bacterium]|nr:alpha-glucan family phosphorylase [Candidatus Binataceae bacterium]